MDGPRINIWNFFNDELSLYYFGENKTIIIDIDTDAQVRFFLQRDDYPKLYDALAALLEDKSHAKLD